jgi:hypothetical protein
MAILGAPSGPAPQDISMVPEATVHGLDTTPDQKCLGVLGKAAKGKQCGSLR